MGSTTTSAGLQLLERRGERARVAKGRARANPRRRGGLDAPTQNGKAGHGTPGKGTPSKGTPGKPSPTGGLQVSSQTLEEPDLYLGLLAIRNEFVNLSELKHCVDVRRKLFAKNNTALDLGEVLVQQRYLTPQDLEYLHMLKEAKSPDDTVEMKTIEAEFDAHVAELKPGAVFGDYRIDAELGRGGMGIVFQAFHTIKEEECALKILIGGKDATVRDIERFKKEATVMAPLIHEGIVKIFEVGRHKGLDFIAMEFVEGVSMKELVGDKPVASDVALLAIHSAAEAVGFMHSHGIIHRDIKP